MNGKANPKTLLSYYLTNLQVSIKDAYYRKVEPDWGMSNDNPQYDRFYIFKSGEGFININGKLYHPKPDQFFLLPAGVKHSYGTVHDNTFLRYYCHFTAKIGRMNLFQMLDLPYCLDSRSHPCLERNFEKLVHYHSSDSITAKAREQAALLELISCFIECCLAEQPEEKLILPQDQEKVKMNTVLNYIQDNLGEKITIEQLAGLIHFHPNYFISVFKKMMGITPIRYMNDLRMEKAKSLLRKSELSIAQIADAVGIPWSQFAKVFRRYTGQSPSEYRKHANE